MSLVGIAERRVLNKINLRLDDLVIGKIINEFLYPKLPFLQEVVEVSKYYKIAHFLDAYNYYNLNKTRVIEYIEETNTRKCKHGTSDYFNMFRHHYMDFKGCVINVKKTFQYNDFDSIENMQKNLMENMNLITSPNNEYVLNSFVLIDSSIMIRSYKKIITDMYDFCILRRRTFVSQRDYLYVMDNMEHFLDEYLLDNHKDILDKTYDDKVDMFIKL